MKFNSETLKSILVTNFNYKIGKSDIFGNVIETDPRTAYRFCLTTNSYYLVDKLGLRIFGRFITYNHRDSSLNQGLYLLNSITQEIEENQIVSLYNQYPYMFNTNKKIILYDYDNSTNIDDIYHKIKESNENPEDYILNFVHLDGSNWEHYFEFIASEYFINKSYITDIQLPWSYRGCPDFGIYKHPIIHKLQKLNLIKKGVLVLELNTLLKFKLSKVKQGKINNGGNSTYLEFSVGEAKTKTNKSQILTYLKTGIPIKGYEFIPNKKTKEDFCGLLTLDSKFNIKIQESVENIEFNPERSYKDAVWFNKYLKIHLLANLNLVEIKTLTQRHLGSCSKLNFTSMNKLVESISFSQILEAIINGI